jgi:hypothetical protein
MDVAVHHLIGLDDNTAMLLLSDFLEGLINYDQAIMPLILVVDWEFIPDVLTRMKKLGKARNNCSFANLLFFAILNIFENGVSQN